MTQERALPVVAHRLEPGDVVFTDKDGQVQIDRKQAASRRTLATVQEVRGAGRQVIRVLLTDTDGRAWSVWPTDVAWLILDRLVNERTAS